ncbi:MAG TPA: S8 family serine peptidase [Bacteroidia bacterium]|nr:S8 family serine peptidase [Bacteroidia bacterium]
MKKNLTLFILLIFNSFFLAAQDYSKLNYTLVKKIIETREPNRPAALFVQGDVNFIKWKTAELGGYFKYSAGDVAAVVLPISKVMEFKSDPRIIRLEDNYMKLEPMNDSMVVKNRIVDANTGVAPLPQGYDGTGVVMGFIDSGIDFTHPDYQDSLGNTRVKFLWDHTLTGNAPQPYNYGSEFNSYNIDNGQANASQDNSNGHGTHVTGVAAGNGLAINHFAGVAPKVDIISVEVNWNLPDDNWLNSVADGVEYIYTKADSMGKPCVINISAGVVLGSHDGKDLQAVAISNLISQQNGRALVCAAGNFGNHPLHLRHNIVPTDTAFTWFAYNPNIGNSIYIEMWATQADFTAMKFTIAMDKVSPYYEFRGMMPYSMISQHVGIFKTDTLKNINGQRVALVQSLGSLAAGRYSMIFNILPDSTSGYNYRLMTTGTGIFDLWNYYVPYNNIVSTGLPTAAVFPDITKYVLPDYTQNIVSSFTCSDKVIAVGNYINKSSYQACDSSNVVGTDIPGALSANSSIGPTRDGRIKPEITASGTLTFAPVRVAYAPLINPIAMALGCLHLRDGGTSTASPVVAGVAALFFQRFPNANWFDVKQAVELCAYTDSFVNASGSIPNNIWGYGKVDGFQTIIPCAAVGIHETQALTNDNFYVSPNPFNDQAVVHYDLTGMNSKKGEIKVFDAIGNEVRKISISKMAGEIVLKKQDFRSGIYFISLIADGQTVTTKKLVIL